MSLCGILPNVTDLTRNIFPSNYSLRDKVFPKCLQVPFYTPLIDFCWQFSHHLGQFCEHWPPFQSTIIAHFFGFILLRKVTRGSQLISPPQSIQPPYTNPVRDFPEADPPAVPWWLAMNMIFNKNFIFCLLQLTWEYSLPVLTTTLFTCWLVRSSARSVYLTHTHTHTHR